MRIFLAVALAALGLIIAPHAIADDGCGPGGPPPGAVSKDVSAVYGQPATMWLTNYVVGITTAEGYGQTDITDPSPLARTAMFIDAQQDGSHQIIVDTGRDAVLYAVSGCNITNVIDQSGACFVPFESCQPGAPFTPGVPLVFDVGHRYAKGDGIGCIDMGDGRRLAALLRHPDTMTVSRTEVILNGANATLGRSDTVAATSKEDPVWTTAGMISCGDLTITKDGLQGHW